MPYPETTDAFAVTDIKNWSTFKRQEVSDTSIALR
jgi:alcohol dehydrogenase (NADP+)